MGLVLSIAFRVRAGVVLAGCALVMAVAFVVLPEGRLWNARLLPFYYLCLYLLAAVGVAEVGRTLAVLAAPRSRASEHRRCRSSRRSRRCSSPSWPWACRCARCPFGQLRADGSYAWMGLTNGINQGSFVRSWARWNYTGYEGKDAYAEYRDLMLTMEEVGEEHGCGRAFWEYEKEINRYGTPMALMLLPHWTDGCIGSMEGLFFEASATTPFHFLTQVELSASPSAAQRDLPYGTFDIDKGVRHLQLMGVRYYIATSAQATTAARGHPDLTELATSGPWVIFEVADSELVEPLENEPAVLDGVSDAQHDWICRTKDEDGSAPVPPSRGTRTSAPSDVMLASSGPEEWQRVDPDDPQPEARPVPGTERQRARGGHGPHRLRRRHAGIAGAREGVVLPQLAGGGSGRPVPGRAEPHGGGAHRRARRAHLRARTRRVDRVRPHGGRHRAGDRPRRAATQCARPQGRRRATTPSRPAHLAP